MASKTKVSRAFAAVNNAVGLMEALLESGNGVGHMDQMVLLTVLWEAQRYLREHGERLERARTSGERLFQSLMDQGQEIPFDAS